MAKIDTDGLNRFQNGVKNPLISIYDKLNKIGKFDLIKDEFDHMMSFVNDVQNWEKDTTQDVKVVINDVSYKPANQ
tara:strand:+ start:2970 stop:3197 length:228 start_codon:yes stop_codon:yes gene_type:complete